jgi:hypothetical protein
LKLSEEDSWKNLAYMQKAQEALGGNDKELYRLLMMQQAKI